MEGPAYKQNKLDKSSNFAVNAKHAIEEQSQSQSCLESKVGAGFRPIDWLEFSDWAVENRLLHM